MFAKVYTVGVVGLDANAITVEADITNGLYSFNIVGLAGKSVQESKDRVFTSIRNSGFEMPMKRITVNLSPADIAKNSTNFDLPIAVAILKASGQLIDNLEDKIIWGELSLDGFTQNSKGALVVADSAKKLGFNSIILPRINAKEARIVAGINIYPIKHLSEIVSYKWHKRRLNYHGISRIIQQEDFAGNNVENDFAYVKGQSTAKRIAEISSAGGHNLLLTGPPGSGKTFISKCVSSILPSMQFEEMIELSKIYSVSGLLKAGDIVTQRPFRSPHHTTSHIALIGGGSYPKPGEISLAHRGVLFLDEFGEFESRAIESLRQPLESKYVNISRASGVVTFPSNFMLIAATNPCKCGYFGVDDRCKCNLYEVRKYKNKLSGPILDRIDLQIIVKELTKQELKTESLGESSASIKKRVENARGLQLEEFKTFVYKGVYANADLNDIQIKKLIKLEKGCGDLLDLAMDKLHLTARSYFRLLKVSKTIANLEGSREISKSHLAEAISYRI